MSLEDYDAFVEKFKPKKTTDAERAAAERAAATVWELSDRERAMQALLG